ncbi:MAG: hypothetical protein PWP52_1725 [Bacteroidales bacterium]|nr:hypothetical protein [Bacteroidales bacterium]
MKLDLRVQKTQEAIKSTFKEMVCEMSASKITVKELTERARIHRKTFYLHYTSIEALFEDMMQEAANQYFAEIDQISPTMPMLEVNRVFFNYLSQQDTFTERLICSKSYREFCNKFFITALEHNRKRFNPYSHLPEAEQNIVNTFTTQSSLDMYRQWVADGKKIPLDRLIELTGMLLSSGTDSITKNHLLSD